MEKKRVLVYPAGTEIGLEVARSLQFSRHFELIGANSIRDHSDILYPTLVDGMPTVADKEALIAKILEVIAEYKVDVLYPAHDEVMELFSSIEQKGLTVIAPRESAAKVLRYKSATYKALEGADFLPEVVGTETFPRNFPLFARPDRGQGSVGVFRINSQEQLNEARKRGDFYLITEFLPGAEYTVDCFTDKDGNLLYLCARERHRIRNGICVRASESDSEEFKNIAAFISSRIAVRGAWFFQLKRDKNGELRLMEVANRVAGSMGYERLKGANLVQATLWDALGHAVDLPKPPKADFVYDRALYDGLRFPYRLDRLYVDLDDTLVFEDGSLNHELVGYIYGLKYNCHTEILLLTRHKFNVESTLSTYGLGNLFDRVLHITDGRSKAEYIEGARVALVDDSFAERRAVSSTHGNAICVGPEGQRILSGFLNSPSNTGDPS